MEAVQSGGGSLMVEATMFTFVWVEFSASVYIFTVLAKLCKCLIMEWKNIPNLLHIIRSCSIAEFYAVGEKMCHRYSGSIHVVVSIYSICTSWLIQQ